MISVSLSNFNNNISFYKNTKKRWQIFAIFFMLSNDDVFASSEFFINVQRMGHSRLMHPYGFGGLYSSLSVAKRTACDFNDPSIQESLLVEQTIKRQEKTLDKYEEFFKKCELFFKEAKTCLKVKRQKVQLLRSPKVNLNLALITPYNFEQSLAQNAFPPHEDASLVSVQKKIEKLKASTKAFEDLPLSDERVSLYQEVTKKIKKMREDLIINIIENSRSTKKINQQQLVSIVELYEALIHRPKNSITKHLKGLEAKGDVYKEFLLHIKSRGSDIETYRKTYAKLNADLGEEVSHAIIRSSENIIKKRNIKKINHSQITMENCALVIAEGSNPLYPVYPHEVESMLVLYRSLINRPKNSITKVLNSTINGEQSPIYKEVVDHITQKGSDIQTYRNIYLRTFKALNDTGMHIIRRIIDVNLDAQDQDLQQDDQNPVLMTPLIADTSVSTDLNEPSQDDCDEQSLSDSNDQDITSTNDSIHDPIETPLDERHQMRASTPSLSITEQKRLNRLYGLLPEYHGKSIACFMSGRTVNTSLPIFKDIEIAINQIKEEVIKEGDNTVIDLDYFKRLFQVSSDSGPTKMPRDCFSNDRLWSFDGKYSISREEQERLSQIYSQLQQYHGKSITGVLSGFTTGKKLPIWNDFLNAIEIIKEKAKKQGDPTVIDLQYFRKLYWSSVRVVGKGNIRDLNLKK